MKNLISLSAIMILLLPTIILSKPSAENNRQAIEALQKSNELLKQEEQRWIILHNNPVTDVWTVEKDGENLIVKVKIDDGVSNIINDQPIQRKYTLVPDEYKLWAPFDLMMSGSLFYPIGWRPTFGVGYTPSWSHGFGATMNTTFMNINAGVYYTNKLVPFAFVQGLIGVSYSGQICFGIGIGIKI